MGVSNCSMYCCTLLYVHSSIAIILMGKRELIALLNLSSWCLVMVERLFLTVPRGCLQFVIVVFPDHTHLLFWIDTYPKYFLASGNFYHLLISFASRLDPDQVGQSVLVLFQTVLHSDDIPELMFQKSGF